MRILARVHAYPPRYCAGAEMMLHEMLRALVDRGHEVRVWLSRGRGIPYELDGVEVFPGNSGDWTGEASAADVLVTHLDQSIETIGVASVLRKPLVQVIHNTRLPVQTWLSCKADLVVFNSEWMARELGPDPRSIVVRPPVFAKDYATDNDWRLGYVTLVNLAQCKGGLVFTQLATTMPDIRFLGVDGAYGEQLHPDLPNVEIRSHGSAPMRSVYEETAILLIPSTYESWGRVGVEAMASGIPVIATPTPGLQESLGDAGIFVECHDLEGWQREIRRLTDNALAYQLAAARSLKRSSELDPTDDLARWCAAVEAL